MIPTHRPPSIRSITSRAIASALACAIVACGGGPPPTTTATPIAPRVDPSRVQLVTPPPLAAMGGHYLIPVPVSVVPGTGAPFAITATTTVVVPAATDDASREAARIGDQLARLLRPATGFNVPVSTTGGAAPQGAIVVRLGGPADLGAEGYTLVVSADSVVLSASAPAGLFYATQTLRQLLPSGIEAEQWPIRGASAWTVPPGRITDRPRFTYRGMMLDVSRHFFTVDEVEQLVDLLGLYKMNMLHLHLSDDQGWRIQIDSRPRLTAVGGATEVGGRGSGFYTKADYAEIVRYARDRFVTIVPEIDMPAHTNAAVASYPELGCGQNPPDASPNAPLPGLYTGIEVGFSALCHDKESTYAFVEDVVRELAAMTPGPYLHIGGDEVKVLTPAQYAQFIDRVQDIVHRHGKTVIGWDEIGRAHLQPGTVAELWRADTSMLAARQGAKLILAPATNAYIDMKYTPSTEVGHRWAAFIELRTAYDWDPVTHFAGVRESDVLGVEAPLWTETVKNITAAEYLILPRLPAIAELGWSPASTHNWESFRTRIAAHGHRWRMLGANFYASPQVDWQP